MTAFCRHIGVSFQLIDDVLDFSSDAEILGKNLLADISQGKMTLPVILASAEDSNVTEALNGLKSGESVAECAASIAKAVVRSNALDATRAEAQRQTSLAIASLEEVTAPNNDVLTILKQLALGLLQRGS